LEILAGVLLAVIFGGVVVHQLSGRGPSTWLIFLTGALLTVVLGVLSVPSAELAVATQLPVFAFLFSLFIFAIATERSGALDRMGRWLLGRARHPKQLPFVVFVGFGVLAAFVVNDALVLLGVPLLIAVARKLEAPATPLLLTLAFAVTVGSVLTPLGNPQNLLVSLSSGIASPIATFLRYLLVPTAINLALGGVYLRYRFGPRFAASSPAALKVHRIPLFPEGGWAARLRQFPVLVVFPGTLVILLTTELLAASTGGAQLPVYEVTLTGALLTLLLTPSRGRLVTDVDWSILLLFAGLFVVVAGAVQGGVVAALQSFILIPPPGHTDAAIGLVLLASLGGAQVFSNVPWVALQIPVLHGLGYTAGTPLVWIALASGSTLAGNLTLLGAASNIIIVHRARRFGERLTLREFVRDGLPITGITLSVLYVCLLLGL
jgi:Na+/H+ antiporter NhaD/arsenite permease-like protein